MLVKLSRKVTTAHRIRTCSHSYLEPGVAENECIPNCWNFDFNALGKYLPLENLKLLGQHLPRTFNQMGRFYM